MGGTDGPTETEGGKGESEQGCEFVSNEEAWDMATRLMVLLDALVGTRCSAPVDNPLLTDSGQECDQLSRPIDSS